ncbi:hypothetical protein D3C78_1137240 [compost metagenome]
MHRHLSGDHVFAQRGTVVSGIGFAVDQQQPAAETFLAQTRCRCRACGASADNDEGSWIVGRWWVGTWHRLIADPDVAVTDFEGIALEAVQGWRFTQPAILDPKLRLVPRTGQASMTNRPVRQRGSGVRAFGLISAQLFTSPQQQDLAVLDLHFQTPVFGHIGDTRNAMQSHDCSPDRRFTYESGTYREVQPIAPATA